MYTRHAREVLHRSFFEDISLFLYVQVTFDIYVTPQQRGLRESKVRLWVKYV